MGKHSYDSSDYHDRKCKRNCCKKECPPLFLIGPQGPQGPKGDQGPTGPQGPLGPTGAVPSFCVCGNEMKGPVPSNGPDFRIETGYVYEEINDCFKICGTIDISGIPASALLDNAWLTLSIPGDKLGLSKDFDIDEVCTAGTWNVCARLSSSQYPGEGISHSGSLRANYLNGEIYLYIRNNFGGDIVESSFDLLSFQVCGKKKPCVSELSDIKRSFEGLKIAEIPAYDLVPPDPTNAVGPCDIVNAVNAALTINSKLLLNQTFAMDLMIFFASVGGTPENVIYDPWLVYDQYVERFVLVALENDETNPDDKRGYMYLAISKASTFSDPPVINDWYLYKLDRTGTSPNGNTFPDYEKLGYDDKAYYITGNDFSLDDGSYQGVSLFAIEKASILTGGAPLIVYDTYTQMPSRLDASGVFPVQSYDASPNAMYFVTHSSDTESYYTTRERIFTLTDILGTPVLTEQLVPINPWDFADDVFPPAPATVPLDVLASRPMSGIARDSKVWSAYTIKDLNVDENRTLVRWACFDVSTPVYTVIQQETISNTPEETDNLFVPHLNVDACGNMGIVMSIASESRFPGIAYTGRAAYDPLNTTRPVKIARAGDQTYQTTSEGSSRWGDYAGLALDPVDQRTFWLFHEYAANDTENDPSEIWATYTGSFTMGCCTEPVIVRELANNVNVFAQNRNVKPKTMKMPGKFVSSVPTRL